MDTRLLSLQLIETARQRLQIEPGITEADLRRATSDLYFSLFHCVCEAVVEPLGAGSGDIAFKETYRTLYKLADHSFVEKRCREVNKQAFSEPIKRFAQQIIAFKNKRNQADYDPLTIFKRSTVGSDVELAESIVIKFKESPQDERARFGYFVTLKSRN